jgi:hypothetical protein
MLTLPGPITRFTRACGLMSATRAGGVYCLSKVWDRRWPIGSKRGTPLLVYAGLAARQARMGVERSAWLQLTNSSHLGYGPRSRGYFNLSLRSLANQVDCSIVIRTGSSLGVNLALNFSAPACVRSAFRIAPIGGQARYVDGDNTRSAENERAGWAIRSLSSLESILLCLYTLACWIGGSGRKDG